MSDGGNVVNLNDRLEKVSRERAEARQPGRNGTSGGGPHDPALERRVSVLEGELKDVKAGLQRIELSTVEIKTAMQALSTRTDVASIAGAVTSLERRNGTLEDVMRESLKAAISKSIGPWQLPAILAASAAVLLGAATAFRWLAAQPWFAR